MPLGLGSNLSRAISKPITPGIVTDNLVLKHKYDAGSVVPVSDGAAYFDGAGDDGVTTSLVPNYTNITMSAWIWPVADGDTKAIATARDAADDGFLWYVTGSENLYIKMQGTSANSGALRANTWQHVAFTWDGTTITSYLNGVPSTASKSGTADLSDTLTIGNEIGSSYAFNGYICNVGIWNATLTQAQIKSIMNKKYSGLISSEKTNLQGWWNLDESHETSVLGQGPIVYDNHHSGLTTYGDELLNWDSNFTGTGISTGNVGDFITNANNSTTFTYIDNDNKTLRLQTDSDGDHVQIKYEPSSAILEAGAAYKMVVTVTSLTGRWRIRPAADDPDADMLAAGTYTFLWDSSDSTYWRVERDTASQVNDITISDVKIYKINGNVGLLI